MAIQQTRRAGTTVRRVGDDHAHLQCRAIGAVAPGVKHVARVAAKVAHAGVAEDVSHPRRAPVLTRRRRGVARVDDGLLLARAGILLRSSGGIRSAARARTTRAGIVLVRGGRGGSGSLPGSLLGLGGSENLGIALSHELLDVVGKTAQHGLDLLLLGLHVLHLSSLLVLELLQVGLLRLELGLLRIELFLNGLDILDGIAVALVDLLDVVRVGNELLKRTRGQQQRQNVGAARLIAGRNAIGKIAALLFELGLLPVNLRLCVVDLALHALDIVEGLGILVGQRSVFICDAVELGLDLIELGLGRIEFVGGLLGGLGRMGAGGQTKKNGRRSGAEQGLKCGTARKLL